MTSEGHEDWRRKWHPIVRKYWKFSEKHAVKNADLVVCDSKSIEHYIKNEYAQYNPKTTFIAYGSYITPSGLSDDDPKYTGWLASHNLRDGEFYISVTVTVRENNISEETSVVVYIASNLSGLKPYVPNILINGQEMEKTHLYLIYDHSSFADLLKLVTAIFVMLCRCL